MNVVSLKDFFKWTTMFFFRLSEKIGNSCSYPVWNPTSTLPLVSRGLGQRVVWYTRVIELIYTSTSSVFTANKCNKTCKCHVFLCTNVMHQCILFSAMHVMTLVCFKWRHIALYMSLVQVIHRNRQHLNNIFKPRTTYFFHWGTKKKNIISLLLSEVFSLYEK